MNKLIVIANPSSKGFSHRITKQYSLLSQKNGDNVEIIDLYKTTLGQDFLTYERKRDIGGDEITREIQKKIVCADKIILIFPIWWADAPAIMKNFFDCNFTTGFAYRRAGRKLVGLLNNKTAEIICTCQAPSFVYKFFPINLRISWGWMKFNICGIKLNKITIFGNIEQITDLEKDQLLNKIKV